MALANSLWLFPFSPAYQTVVPVSDTSDGAAIGEEGNTIIVQNVGPNTAFFLFDKDGTTTPVAPGVSAGGGPMTATGVAQPILAGAIMSFLVSPGQLYVVAICESGETAFLYLSRGTGQ